MTRYYYSRRSHETQIQSPVAGRQPAGRRFDWHAARWQPQRSNLDTGIAMPAVPPTMDPNAPTPPANVYAPVFAAFKPVAVNIPAKFNGGDYSLPVDLGNVQFAR